MRGMIIVGIMAMCAFLCIFVLFFLRRNKPLPVGQLDASIALMFLCIGSLVMFPVHSGQATTSRTLDSIRRFFSSPIWPVPCRSAIDWPSASYSLSAIQLAGPSENTGTQYFPCQLCDVQLPPTFSATGYLYATAVPDAPGMSTWLTSRRREKRCARSEGSFPSVPTARVFEMMLARGSGWIVYRQPLRCEVQPQHRPQLSHESA
jgi:hypothetical protein